jgi:hypothetical protein
MARSVRVARPLCVAALLALGACADDHDRGYSNQYGYNQPYGNGQQPYGYRQPYGNSYGYRPPYGNGYGQQYGQGYGQPYDNDYCARYHCPPPNGDDDSGY